MTGQTQMGGNNPAPQGSGEPPGPADQTAQGGNGPGSSANGRSQRDFGGSRPATGNVTMMDDAHQQFSQALMDQVEEDVDAGAQFLPNSQTIMQAVQQVHRTAAALHGQQPAAFVEAYGRLNDPLATMINLLRAELDRSTRQHELTDQDIEQAPPAYRAAVAEYFERLSRDYETAPEKKQ